MSWRRQVRSEAAPGIRQEPLLGLEHPSPHRVEMHVVTSRPEITVATALDQLSFVSSAEHVPEELMAMVKPDGVGALQPRLPGY